MLVQALERYWAHSRPDDASVLELTRDALDALKVMHQDKVAKDEAD